MKTAFLRGLLAAGVFLAASGLSRACDDNYDPGDDIDPGSQDDSVGLDPDTGATVIIPDSGGGYGDNSQPSDPPPSPPAPASQNVASADQTIVYGTADWSPPYYGGAGTGAWEFVVSDYTDWQGAGWTPPGAGSYIFYVQNVGDANYAPATAGPYNLTVSPADNGTVGISPDGETILAGQSVAFTAAGGATGNYSWGGAASGGGGSQTVAFSSAGTYVVTVQDMGDGNTNPSNTASAEITVVNPAPPSASVTVTPSSGIAPLAVTVSWNAANADSSTISGAGLASSQPSGSQTVELATPGSYTWTVNATGPGGTATQSAEAAAGGYTLQTAAIGAGSVTPGGGPYAAGTVVSLSAAPGPQSVFTGWSGNAAGSADPLTLTLDSDLTVYADFSAQQAQTIAFAPPANATYPGPALTLAATASSGLPVAFTLISGPAALSGSRLTLTGTGPVLVQASQAGGGLWLPAPPVTAAIAVAAPAAISRFRFSSTGTEARAAEARATGASALIWTDPSALPTSPWPSFLGPQAATPAAQNTILPAVPAAPSALP